MDIRCDTSVIRTRVSSASPRRRSRFLAAIAVFVVFVGGSGCSSDPHGPDERALLPASDLVYPGAKVKDRNFFEASRERTVDGTDNSNDAALVVDIVFDRPTEPPEILKWYRKRLEAQGWKVTFETAAELHAGLVVDRTSHRYTVQASPSGADAKTATGAEIVYSMAFLRPG